MTSGDPNKSEIIEYPENWEDMKKKHQEREEEQLKKALAKRKAESVDELKDIAINAIAKRARRTASDQKPLKDRTILREERAEEIKSLRKQFDKEIFEISQRILNEFPKQVPSLEKKVLGLKGRVSKGPTSGTAPATTLD